MTDGMKTLRTKAEQQVGPELARIFEASPDTTEEKLDSFPKYVRRQALKRFLALYEIFRQVLDVKGSVVECGVFRGFGLMSWAHLSAILEPENLTRRIYGFDTFKGLTGVVEQDNSQASQATEGALRSDSLEELRALVEQYDANRFLGHVNKVQLVEGDVTHTVPDFIAKNPHLVVSLLFLDMDLYEPTRVAIENLVPRMPRGAVIAFDELDNPIWPGETMALLETVGIRSLRLKRLEWDPYIAYATIE